MCFSYLLASRHSIPTLVISASWSLVRFIPHLSSSSNIHLSGWKVFPRSNLDPLWVQPTGCWTINCNLSRNTLCSLTSSTKWSPLFICLCLLLGWWGVTPNRLRFKRACVAIGLDSLLHRLELPFKASNSVKLILGNHSTMFYFDLSSPNIPIDHANQCYLALHWNLRQEIYLLISNQPKPLPHMVSPLWLRLWLRA